MSEGSSRVVIDATLAAAKLRETPVPQAVLEVAQRLQAAGHAAVLVGGCVRDALLDRPHGDWDLASSATPTEVQGLFRRTIPTGLEHGTITVMVGKGDAREGVEITTFRGEGSYVDGRRPTEVTFLRDLRDDLARRDFTINAFAWDPVREEFTDAFDGLQDLQERVVRAVGTALHRFQEDGLRVMRAVRFAATLGFDLEAKTEAAIAKTLEVFDKVSRERVRVELFKLLRADRPSRGLAPMARQGLWGRVLLPVVDTKAAIAGCDARPARVEVRLAWLLRCAGAEGLEGAPAVLDALKPSRAQRADVLRLLAPWLNELADPATSPAHLRRRCGKLGRDNVGDALDVLGADEATRQRLAQAIDGNALSGKELAIAGRDLIAADIMKPGRGLGELLAALLDEVYEDPALNTREALLARASERAGEFG